MSICWLLVICRLRQPNSARQEGKGEKEGEMKEQAPGWRVLLSMRTVCPYAFKMCSIIVAHTHIFKYIFADNLNILLILQAKKKVLKITVWIKVSVISPPKSPAYPLISHLLATSQLLRSRTLRYSDFVIY